MALNGGGTMTRPTHTEHGYPLWPTDEPVVLLSDRGVPIDQGVVAHQAEDDDGWVLVRWSRIRRRTWHPPSSLVSGRT